MIYSEFLKKGSRIGVTAPSDGVSDELDKARFLNSEKKLREKGFDVVFTNNVFQTDEKGRSSDKEVRAREYEGLIEDEETKLILSAKGGNFLNEMLEVLDFEKIARYPKWFQGYSDNTGLIHTLTTKYDIAAIYGSNFGEFGMDEWHESVVNNVAAWRGENIAQKSFERYQQEMTERVTGLEGYSLDTPVKGRLDEMTLRRGEKVEITGRLLGGCLDVLLFLQGTPYDGTMNFIEKYKEDGILWYLESFDISGENMMMFLWKLRETGWFKYSKGFIFGRPLFYKDFTNTPYSEAGMYALGSLDVPVIFDSDFGHRGPRMTIINGALGKIKCHHERCGSLEMFCD